MRPYTKKQLEKSSYLNLNNCTRLDGGYFIPKYTAPRFEVNENYIIQVNRELVDAPNSLLATNWNRGTAPKAEFLKIYVTQVSNGMLYVNSVAMQSPDGPVLGLLWCGWLPVRDVKYITKC